MRVKAMITANVGSTSKRQFPIQRVEAYTIATAIDTDADEFSVDIGDPRSELTFLLNRDTELVVSLFTQGEDGQVEWLHEGIADTTSASSEDGIFSIKGRDFSSIAVDSQAPPGEWAGVEGKRFVTREASRLGFKKFNLVKTTEIPKFSRDGSETYWESWYRIYRIKGMYLWVEPDGTLSSGYLNYSTKAEYLFGIPTDGHGTPSAWIPVEEETITKSAQGRIGFIRVYGESGAVGFRYPSGLDPLMDQSIKNWIRRPYKIITDTTIKTVADAKARAWNEIHDSKVGALEISFTAVTNRIIKQNTIAYLNLPTKRIHGLFFVVGVTRQGSGDGETQIVRLRERQYALPQSRPPSEPPIDTEPPGLPQTPPSQGGGQLDDMGIRWGQCFWDATNQFHGGWDWKLFLGVLLSICWVESGFKNVRQGSDVEWFDIRIVPFDIARDQWNETFANEIENPLTHRHEWGVGPMQLTTRAYKTWADDKGGLRDEYFGGRWQPCPNIWAGAKAFKGKLDQYAGDSGNDKNIWIGVERYNGSGAAAVAYRKKVYHAWKVDPGYEAIVDSLILGAAGNPVIDDQGNEFPITWPPDVPDKIQKFATTAIDQLGKPYVWGGNGPDNFDCSGLIYYCATQAGLDVGGDQDVIGYWKYSKFTPVNMDQLLIGDLVFFNNFDHMGIYLSDNHFIQAPHTGDVVKISALTGDYLNNYEGAMRTLKWGF